MAGAINPPGGLSHPSWNPPSPRPQGDINHSLEMSLQLGHLLRDEEEGDVTICGDVTIACGAREFSCHKAILAARSQYFRALLYGGMKESRPGALVHIKDVNPDMFEVLLGYLYSCSVSLARMSTSQVLELLELAHRYELSLLEEDICSYLKTTQINTTNAAEICQLATFYNLHQLQEDCLTLIDSHPSVPRTNLPDLSYHTLHAIVSRDSYPLPELEILEIVQAWLADPAHSVTPQESQHLLSDIRLSLIPAEDLFLKILPTELFSSEHVLEALRAQTLLNHVELPHRGVCVAEKELVSSQMMRVLSGENGEVLFAQFEGVTEKPHCRHSIGDQEGITVKLIRPHIVNKISFLLPSNNKEFNRLYSYQVCISMNGTVWRTVADYSQYHCHGWQHIVLPTPRSLLYVRIVGLLCSTSKTFCLEQISLKYDKSVRFTSVDSQGIIAPIDNIATIERGAIVVEGVSKHRATLLNGNTSDYNWEDGYTCHQVGSGSIIVLLNQPYLISTMALLLWDCDERAYSYVVSVSKDNSEWLDVIDKSDKQCSSWQYLHLAQPQPISYIRVIGTQNSANSVFHLVHIELPSQPRHSSSYNSSNSDRSSVKSESGSVDDRSAEH